MPINRLQSIVESRLFQNVVIGVIVFNSIILGLETSPNIAADTLAILLVLDKACLAFFVLELVLKFFVYRLSFFRSGWNVFDFVIVMIALIPTSEALAVLRAFRIFRALRLVTAIDSLRRVVSGMLTAIPGVGSVFGLLLIVFYVASVISTTLFGEQFPEWFGNIGASMYTLFQIMTLESWSMGIVRPVMAEFPYAWVFFVPFIAVTTFMVLNLFIGIIVDAMATVKEEETHARENEEKSQQEIHAIKKDIEALHRKLDRLLE